MQNHNTITFRELRKITASVKAFIRTEYWGERLHSRMEIEKDLGITGDDAQELMLDFAEEYEVDLSNFRFDRHFYREHDPISYILQEMMLLNPVRDFVSFTCQFFDANLARQIREYSPRKARLQEKVPLTVGDLIVSALKKEFICRNSPELPKPFSALKPVTA